jgi:hypothetical protein
MYALDCLKRCCPDARPAIKHLKTHSTLDGCENMPMPHVCALIERCALLTQKKDPYVVGVDVGFRNLAICVVRGSTIYAWKVIDVFEVCGLTKRPNAAILSLLILRVLDEELGGFLEDGCSIIIEQQPKNRVRACANAAIAEQIFTHFASRAHVRFRKPACTRAKTVNTVAKSQKRKRYVENKRIVVVEAENRLADFVFASGVETPLRYLAGLDKKDDAADSFLLTQ